MNRFHGKVAIITGASRGIGLDIARRIVEEGGRVIITARHPEALEEAAASLGGDDVVRWLAGKADDSEHRRQMLALAVDWQGHLDHLVVAAGVNPAYGPMREIEDWAARKILDVNVLATMEWIRAAEPVLADGGSIVTVASIAGITASPGIGFYGVSKAAVMALTTQFAAELAPRLRVNSVAPAVIKTDFARALYQGREAEAAAGYRLGRLGSPSDVSGPVAFLLSDDAAWMSGQTLVIDGGGTTQSLV